MVERSVGGTERGSGSVLAIALIAALLGALTLLLVAASAFAVKGAVANAADAAALAAADARVGVVSGYPCERAREVAERNGATLDSCTVDGLVATVSVRGEFLGFAVTTSASAGPAPP